MDQKQLPLPQQDVTKQQPQEFTRILPAAPQSTDTLQRLDKMLEAETTRKKGIKRPTPKCCGRLPCKGRTPFCYQCDICVDCITSIGCGHPSSRHEFRNSMSEDKPNV